MKQNMMTGGFVRVYSRKRASLFAGETCMPLDWMCEVMWASLLGVRWGGGWWGHHRWASLDGSLAGKP